MCNKVVFHRILYFYFQEYLFNLPQGEREKFSSATIAGKLRKVCIGLVLHLKERFLSSGGRSVEMLRNKNWIFVFGKNNFDSTAFLEREGFVFVTDRPRRFNGADKVSVLPLQRRFRNYLAFPFLIRYLKAVEGRRALEIFDLIFNAIGWYEAFDVLLKDLKPGSIVFSNDHYVVPRALLFAAKANRIPTIFIQHAAVTKDFPPLEFDLSLLEGEDALHKYSAKGIAGKVRLIGMPRFDSYVSMRKRPCGGSPSTVGMAFNTLDSIPVVQSVVKELIKAFPTLRIILRKHPKDKRDFTGPFSAYRGCVDFSDPLEERPFDFIVRCDVLLAGNSSVHLDARLLNVPSYFFDFDRQSRIRDLYGFVENGLVEEIHHERQLVETLSAAPFHRDVYLQAKYYNEAVGTDWEGQSANRAVLILNDFIEEKKVECLPCVQ